MGAVANRPTAFSHGGRLKVMGEAGPEAVMPLSRTSDGKLGVAAMMPNYNYMPQPANQNVQVNLKVEYIGKSKIETQQRTNGNGDIILTIREIAREEAYSAVDESMASVYGARPVLTKRG